MLPTSTIKHTTPPPLIRVAGTHREIGRQIGEAVSGMVVHSIANARVIIDNTYESLQLNWES